MEQQNRVRFISISGGTRRGQLMNLNAQEHVKWHLVMQIISWCAHLQALRACPGFYKSSTGVRNNLLLELCQTSNPKVQKKQDPGLSQSPGFTAVPHIKPVKPSPQLTPGSFHLKVIRSPQGQVWLLEKGGGSNTAVIIYIPTAVNSQKQFHDQHSQEPLKTLASK